MLLVCGSLVGGCSPSKGSAANSGLLVPLAAPTGVVLAPKAMPEWVAGAADSEVELRIALGKDAGKSIKLDCKPGSPEQVLPSSPPVPPDAFLVDWLIVGEKKPRTERTLVRGPDGGISMSRVLDRDHKVITTFDPPLPVLPARLDPRQVVKGQSHVVVHELNDPAKVREQGTALVTIAYTNDIAVPSPDQADVGGASRLRVVRTILQTNFSSAKSSRKAEQWFSDSRGLEAESYEEIVTLLGVVIERTQQTLVRPGGAGEAARTRMNAQNASPGDASAAGPSSGEQLIRDTSKATR